jgi:hypothetical protein
MPGESGRIYMLDSYSWHIFQMRRTRKLNTIFKLMNTVLHTPSKMYSWFPLITFPAPDSKNRIFYSTALQPKVFAAFFILFACSTPKQAAGEDSLQTVMARMKPEGVVAINYLENRYLKLMSGKWTGSGCFYALLPDVMIKEQQLPEKELMAIKGSELYFFNQENGQKHQGEVTEQDSMVAYTTAFKGLMNGDLSYLATGYDIAFTAKPAGWSIALTPKNNAESESGFKVIMQGQPEQAADKLELVMADGDRTEYRLSPAKSGEEISSKITKLLDLLGAN